MRKTQRIIDIENRYGMEYSELLRKMYHEDKMSIAQISKEFNCDKGNMSRQFKKLGIETRKGSEIYANWWENASEETKERYMKDLSDRAKINLVKNRNNPVSKRKDRIVPVGMSMNEYMKTKEYKRKISKANSGKNNGMYKKHLTDEHRTEKRAVFGLKQWSKSVRDRDNNTCQICGLQSTEPMKIHAHHLESFDTHKELRTDIDNGVTLCNSCHNKFHNKYRGQKTNREQFEAYKNEHL